ncbi:hypothetical protein R6Q59_032852 [Mikania micrantha]
MNNWIGGESWPYIFNSLSCKKNSIFISYFYYFLYELVLYIFYHLTNNRGRHENMILSSKSDEMHLFDQIKCLHQDLFCLWCELSFCNWPVLMKVLWQLAACWLQVP